MSWELPDRISVREVGPRDGLQNEDPVPTDAKVALLDALSATGVQRIEAVSFVRPSAIPQMADADEVWKRAARAPSVRYSALVPNLRGALRALDAGFTELEAVVSASETHNRKNVNRSTGESLDEIAEIIAVAHDRGATGNIATEELVHMVEDMGVATGIDLDAMIAAAAEAEGIVGRVLPSQVLRAGPRTRTIAP